jgi:hypothetical protein
MVLLSAELECFMTTRPLLFGYARVHLDARTELPKVRREMRTYAEIEGFTFAELFVEHDQGGTSAFAGLVDLLKRHPGSAVVIPSLTHFAKLTALQEAMRNLIDEETGARVVVLDMAGTTEATS